jgi:hypothetical protein
VKVLEKQKEAEMKR